jgi:hypothetical protein
MRQLLIGWAVAIAASLPIPAYTQPIRVLVYHFSVDAHGFWSTRGVANGGVVRFGTGSTTLGGTGTLTVNVDSATRDGGLVVDVTEHMDRVDHNFQTVRCAVYGASGRVICDQNLEKDGDVPAETTMLLTYLGRKFLDPSRLDANDHWQVKQVDETDTVTADYTVTKMDGDVVTISVDQEERDGPFRSSMTGTLQYDAKLTNLNKAHLVTDAADGGDSGGSIVDFQLVSDSFAKSI